MSVIAEFRVPSTQFELGQILHVDGITSIELESLVPVDKDTILFWVYNSTNDTFIESVQRHPTVNSTSPVDVFEDRALYKLEWDASHDHVFRAIKENEGQLLSATGTLDAWEFELRFPSHDALNRFTADCDGAQVSLEMTRVFTPTEPEEAPWYGLTEPQHEAIMLAVFNGYYNIPRGCTTKELADELGISDQAVTERLRRAIVALVTNTLGPSE